MPAEALFLLVLRRVQKLESEPTLYSVPFQVCSRSASDDLHVKSKRKIKATFYEITPAKNDRLAHDLASPL